MVERDEDERELVPDMPWWLSSISSMKPRTLTSVNRESMCWMRLSRSDVPRGGLAVDGHRVGGPTSWPGAAADIMVVWINR